MNTFKRKSKAIRVFIAEGCNASCPNCFNREIRGNAEITPTNFLDLCNYLRESGFTALKVMGGEPTTHSHFKAMIEIAQRYFHNVSIFTNALNDELLTIVLRASDTVVYNMNFVSQLTPNKLLLNQPGKRSLKIQISEKTDINATLEIIEKWISFAPDRIKPSFTFDCTQNIFLNKDILIEKVARLENEMGKRQIQYGYDHKIPKCFCSQTAAVIHYPSGLCRPETAGLIDTNLNLHYCNQFHENLINLKNVDGAFIPWDIVKNYILKAFYQRQLAILEGPCAACASFGVACNGGCWGKLLAKE